MEVVIVAEIGLDDVNRMARDGKVKTGTDQVSEGYVIICLHSR